MINFKNVRIIPKFKHNSMHKNLSKYRKNQSIAFHETSHWNEYKYITPKKNK